MIPVKVYTAEEVRELDFVIAGQTLSVGNAKDLKIYAGNTTYINKKKVNLSEQDLQTIENARQIYFLYSCEGKAFLDDNTFSTSRFGYGEYTPLNVEGFKSLLSENNISITE